MRFFQRLLFAGRFHLPILLQKSAEAPYPLLRQMATCQCYCKGERSSNRTKHHLRFCASLQIGNKRNKTY
nr:MAG TPA: hypothetical protein [Caudoviricetes sp.]